MTPLEQAKIFVEQAKDRFTTDPSRRRDFAVQRTQAALKIPVAEAEELVDDVLTAPADIVAAVPVVLRTQEILRGVVRKVETPEAPEPVAADPSDPDDE